MGSGKTVVGKALSRLTGLSMVDGDRELVHRAGRPISQIFQEDGEEAFRKLERSVIGDLCAQSGKVIAAGGGSFVDPDNRDIPLTYISFPSAKDPSFTERYPGRATIEIVAPGPFEWYQDWADKPWGKRGEDYEAKKDAYAQRLLEKLYEKMPHLRGKVDYYELSTPLSTDYFCRYSTGEIYGLDHTPERFEQDWLKPKTRLPGLYLTGQDIMTCGVVGAMIGGLLTPVAVSGLKGLPLAKKMFVG